jgi:hypothetical protein
VVAVCCLGGWVACLGGCGGPADASGGGGLSAGAASSAVFQAAVYETSLTPARAGGLDAKALAKLATREEFQKALAALGPTRMLYQADQTVSLTSENQIRIGSQQPFVTNTRTTESGQRVNTIQYENVGAMFKFSTKSVPAGDRAVLNVRLDVELSVPGTSAVEVATGTKARTFRKVTTNYAGDIELGRPFVLVGLDSSAGGDKDPNSVVCVCRVLLSKPGR